MLQLNYIHYMNNNQAAVASFSDGEISAKNKNTKGHVKKRNFCSYKNEKDV
jgi:hypothetical protein